MSEPKKMSDELKELIGLQASRIEKLETLLEKRQSTTSTPDEEKGHRDLDEQLACPTCRAKILEKIKPTIETDVLKALREKQKSFKKPRLCEDCGELLDASQEKDCPGCHGHRY